MTFRILYTESYNRKAEKFISRHPDLLLQYEKTLRLLQVNPFHPSLRLHQHKGPLKDLHSVSINISYRIVLELIIKENEILFINIGKHNQVY